MKNNTLQSRHFAVVLMILVAAAMRLIPHWPNFTPVAAIAIFGGAYLGRNILAFILPLAAMFLSDLVIGLHEFMLPVYAAFAITVCLGILIRNSRSVLRIGAAALVSSVLFFLITNFAMWIGSPYYSQDVAGLMQCYTFAIPFFGYSVAGDLFFTALLFGGFALAERRIPALAR
jgi:hypothetical protein